MPCLFELPTYLDNCFRYICVKCSAVSSDGIPLNANSCLTHAPKPYSDINDSVRYSTSNNFVKNTLILFGRRDLPDLYRPVRARSNPRKNSNICRRLYTDTDYLLGTDEEGSVPLDHLDRLSRYLITNLLPFRSIRLYLIRRKPWGCRLNPMPAVVGKRR